MNRTKVAAAITAVTLAWAVGPPIVPMATVTATPDYQSAVRIALSRAGYEVPNTTGAVHVLDEARDWVCQHRDTNAEVVNTQIQMAGWFNHPSLNLTQADAIRTVALNYC